MRQHPQHLRELIDRGAATAQFGGHTGFDEPRFLERLKIVGDETILVLIASRGELPAEPLGDLSDIGGLQGMNSLRES